MLSEQSNKDNPRAFVARDGCFSSKATKRNLTLGFLELGKKSRKKKEKVHEK